MTTLERKVTTKKGGGKKTTVTNRGPGKPATASTYMGPYARGFQIWSPQAIRGLATSLYGAPMGAGALTRQAASSVRSSIDPIIANISRTYRQRALQGAQAIQGYTGAYMDRLNAIPGQIESANQATVAEQGRMDAALADFIRNRGASMSQNLNQAFTDINAPGAGASADYAAQLGAGASNAIAGQGASTGARMLAQGMADANYARLLPGFAKAQGTQTLGQFGSQLNQEMSSQIGDLTSQVPGMIQSQLGQLQGLEQQKRSGIAGLIDNMLSRNLQSATAAAGLAQNADQINRQYDYQWWNATEGPGSVKAAAAAAKKAGPTLDDRVSSNWEKWVGFANNTKDVVKTDPLTGKQYVASSLGYGQMRKRMIPLIMRTAKIKNRKLAGQYADEVLASLGIVPQAPQTNIGTGLTFDLSGATTPEFGTFGGSPFPAITNLLGG